MLLQQMQTAAAVHAWDLAVRSSTPVNAFPQPPILSAMHAEIVPLSLPFAPREPRVSAVVEGHAVVDTNGYYLHSPSHVVLQLPLDMRKHRVVVGIWNHRAQHVPYPFRTGPGGLTHTHPVQHPEKDFDHKIRVHIRQLFERVRGMQVILGGWFLCRQVVDNRRDTDWCLQKSTQSQLASHSPASTYWTFALAVETWDAPVPVPC